MADNTLKIGSRTLKVSSLDKVIYPSTGFTKGEVIDYYIRISKVLLPHLKNRALTLKRYPDGVEKEFFYEKSCPSYRPSWFKTASVWSKTRGENISFCLVNDLPSLVWVANLADLELHTSLAHAPKVDKPTMIVFDLDPGPGTDILDCAQVAIWLRDLLAKMKLKSFVKTSGSKGMQMYVPLNTPVTFDATKDFALKTASIIGEQHPDKTVTNMKKSLRHGKVLIDWSQNDFHKTTVCVYSLRAKERPSVSTPITWKELEKGLKTKSVKSFFFSPNDAVKRAQKLGDLFEPVLKLKQKLPKSV